MTTNSPLPRERSMYKFIKTPDPDNHHDKTTVIIRVDAVTLDDLVEAFEEFLKGCGFIFDGTLDIVEEEEEHDDA